MRITRVLSLVLVFAAAIAAPASADTSIVSALPGDPDLRSASAIVLDGDGNIIFGKDVDSVRSVASIT